MLEIPEAQTIARQLRETLTGKRILSARAAISPHSFAWYFGDPASYNERLAGRVITGSAAFGGRPEIWAEKMRISFCDGVAVRFFKKSEKLPTRSQLLINFEDGDAISCSVQMFGGLRAFLEGDEDDPYYLVAREKPSPLSDVFSEAYFSSLRDQATEKLSAKAFLATEQRIPGLGNGVLQDILWRSAIHPKRKIASLSDDEYAGLFHCLKATLGTMTDRGGRDTEKDLFGAPGGYVTVMSKKNEGAPCPKCGRKIVRLAYMGGSVYFCEGCQQK